MIFSVTTNMYPCSDFRDSYMYMYFAIDLHSIVGVAFDCI